MNNIGNKIRQIRERNGFSQDSIAIELGITQSTYARLEKDDERISVNRLMQIATILKVSVSELIGEKTQKTSNQSQNQNANAYNADTINTIIHADKEHIQTLRDEINFLRSLLENKKN